LVISVKFMLRMGIFLKLKSLIKRYPLVFVKESWFIRLSRFSLCLRDNFVRLTYL
jgi:hypothetical protein